VELHDLGSIALHICVSRRVPVWITHLPFRFTSRAQALLSRPGLRGPLPIVLATIPATAGVSQGHTIFNIVFFVVVVSTLLQGTTVVPLARRLDLTVDRPAWRSIAEALPLDDSDVDLVEITVTEDLAIAGHRLREVPPGSAMLVTAVVRGHVTLLPRADTEILAGDLLVMAVDRQRASLPDVTAWAMGEVTSPDEVTSLPVTNDSTAFDEDQPA